MNKPPLPLPLSIQRVRDQVSALDSLAAALTAGLHAGVIDPDHVQTLLETYSAGVRARLDEMASSISAQAA